MAAYSRDTDQSLADSKRVNEDTYSSLYDRIIALLLATAMCVAIFIVALVIGRSSGGPPMGVLLLPLLSGMTLLTAGYRWNSRGLRAVTDPMTCHVCRYQLQGLQAEQTACPECGNPPSEASGDRITPLPLSVMLLGGLLLLAGGVLILFGLLLVSLLFQGAFGSV